MRGGDILKVKCVKCQVVDELKEDDIKLLAHIVKRYNPNPRPIDYTGVLSVIKGICTDGEKHIFVFDEDFDKDISGIIQEYNHALNANVIRKEDLEKVSLSIFDITDQIKSLESNLQELEKKKEYIIAEMRSGGILIDSIKLKFLKLTGTDDMSMWEV